MNDIKKAIEPVLNEMGLKVDCITYEKMVLSIVLDSEKLLDLDTITKATKVISPIIDEVFDCSDSYTLDVSSKEKGGNL